MNFEDFKKRVKKGIDNWKEGESKGKEKNWMDISVREGLSMLKKGVNKVAGKIVENTK